MNRQEIGSRRIDAPLKYVTLNNQSTLDASLKPALILKADIDEHSFTVAIAW